MTIHNHTYRYNRTKILERSQQEFLGILKGALADDEIVAPEVAFIAEWLKRHKEIQETWPAKAVQECIMRAMEDGILSADELDDIRDLLRKIVPPLRDGYIAEIPSAPWDMDNLVELSNYRCVLTGEFISGERHDLEMDIISCGGIVKNGVSGKVDYLFVGYLGNYQWKSSNFGLKIEKAVRLKEAGKAIKILTEEVLMDSISMARSR